jgi:hypothetical protein
MQVNQPCTALARHRSMFEITQVGIVTKVFLSSMVVFAKMTMEKIPLPEIVSFAA